MSPRDDGTLVLFFIRLLCRILPRPLDAKVRRPVPLGLQPGLDVHVPPTGSRSIPSSLTEAGEADSLPASSSFTGEKDRTKKNVAPPGILVYMACGGARALLVLLCPSVWVFFFFPASSFYPAQAVVTHRLDLKALKETG